ncbi:MAG: PBECR4 domain-containing protein, partial [Clostridia bacterium]|nr:PBECR4 domain-containing protein [Clostridia bacterium]
MDLLLQRALDFEKITHYKYKYTMGRKGQLYIFEIDFRPSDFHHLIGLQKLTDIEAVDDDREIVFDNILNGKINYDKLIKSSFYEDIRERFDSFENFTKIFNDKNTTYKYTQDLTYSQIPADYLFTNHSYGNPLYVFVKQREDEDLFCCNSFFPFKNFQYERGQR